MIIKLYLFVLSPCAVNSRKRDRHYRTSTSSKRFFCFSLILILEIAILNRTGLLGGKGTGGAEEKTHT